MTVQGGTCAEKAPNCMICFFREYLNAVRGEVEIKEKHQEL